ncbi:MAG: hypothetical protein ACR2O0_10560 [Rhizobiaceae bacterium]
MDTDREQGSEARDLETIEANLTSLASALEPIAIRRSAENLLKVYLGNDLATAEYQLLLIKVVLKG